MELDACQRFSRSETEAYSRGRGYRVNEGVHFLCFILLGLAREVVLGALGSPQLATTLPRWLQAKHNKN